jgi:hypothetical protein
VLLLLLELLRIGQVLTPPSGLPFIGTKVILDILDGSRIEAVSVSRKEMSAVKDECVYNQPRIRIFEVPMPVREGIGCRVFHRTVWWNPVVYRSSVPFSFSCSNMNSKGSFPTRDSFIAPTLTLDLRKSARQ